MDNASLTASETIPGGAAKGTHSVTLNRFAILYARIALGTAFLSAVADRFGLWGKYGGWGNFANFTNYTAQVNSFMPAFVIPFLAWAASAAELSLGIGLILGLWPRWVAFGAATLLFLFGTAMAISFGLKSPLDYSVFSASAGALLLALYQSERNLPRRDEQIH
jgi:putative oxidoreductase